MLNKQVSENLSRFFSDDLQTVDSEIYQVVKR